MLSVAIGYTVETTINRYPPYYLQWGSGLFRVSWSNNMQTDASPLFTSLTYLSPCLETYILSSLVLIGVEFQQHAKRLNKLEKQFHFSSKQFSTFSVNLLQFVWWLDVEQATDPSLLNDPRRVLPVTLQTVFLRVGHGKWLLHKVVYAPSGLFVPLNKPS